MLGIWLNGGHKAGESQLPEDWGPPRADQRLDRSRRRRRPVMCCACRLRHDEADIAERACRREERIEIVAYLEYRILGGDGDDDDGGGDG